VTWGVPGIERETLKRIGRMTDRKKLQYSEKNLLQCHILDNKYHRDCLELKQGLHCEKPETNRLMLDTTEILCIFKSHKTPFPSQNLLIYVRYFLLIIGLYLTL
jgi:hypothetical protein